MTYVEALYDEYTEARIPTADIPTAAPPVLAADAHQRLLDALERRAGLLELQRGIQIALDDAYESRESYRIAWARGGGRDQLRSVATKLLIAEATISHLCQLLCPACVDGTQRGTNPDNDRRCSCTPDDDHIPY